MIDWPPGRAAEEMKKPDTRMLRCLIPGYIECAAKTPEACDCGKLPASVYIERMERKYGKSNG